MLTVLLVDDDSHERAVIERILCRLAPNAFELTQVVWLTEAVKLLKENTFDLVLLDNHLRQSITAQHSVCFDMGKEAFSYYYYIQ